MVKMVRMITKNSNNKEPKCLDPKLISLIQVTIEDKMPIIKVSLVSLKDALLLSIVR